MNHPMQTISKEIGSLADHAREFMSATADIAGEKVDAARSKLASALESGKEMAGHACDKARQGTKAAGEAVKAHPYQAVGIALGVGALVTFVVGRWCACRRD